MIFSTEVNKRIEIKLNSAKEYSNPFRDVDIDAVFTSESGRKIALPGFWNGGNEWKVRFSAPTAEKWTYEITCTDRENSSLTDNGEINAVPCSNPVTELDKHGYVMLKEGKRYMEYADGTPYFYLADTHWMMPDLEHLHDCNYPGCNCGNQFMHMLNDRVKKGFNAYQTYFSSARKKPSHSGTPGWWLDNYDTINPEAFNVSMDIMMEALVEKGFTVSLGFGCHSTDISRFGDRIDSFKAFVRYVVARYACYPVMWITGQEITIERCNAFNIWQEIAELAHSLDGYNRPYGAHLFVHEATDPRAQKINQAPWHQWWTVQGGHAGMDRLKPRTYYKSYRDSLPVKPFIETECQYEDIYCGAFNGNVAPRVGGYQAVLCGSAGFTYGVTGIWAMGYNQRTCPGWPDYSPESWFNGVDKPGSQEMGYMRKFFEYIGWSKLEPEFRYGFGEFENRGKVSIAHIGNDLVVYYFFGRCCESGYAKDLKPNTEYQVRWFDTATGKFIDVPNAVTNEKGEFDFPMLPSLRDWVLLVNNYDLGEYETENYPEFVQPVAPTEIIHGDKIEIKKIVANSEDDNFPAANMLDGSAETCWKPFAPRTGQFILADLGEVKEVGYLYIETHLPEPRVIRFKTFCSVDGEHYDLVSDFPSTNVTLGGQFNGYFDTIKGNYRYIKFVLESYDEQTPIEFSHFEVYKEN